MQDLLDLHLYGNGGTVGLYFGSHVGQGDLEPLILLPLPRSAGVTGVGHLPDLCNLGDQSLAGKPKPSSRSCLLRAASVFKLRLDGVWPGPELACAESLRVQPSLLRVSNGIISVLLSLPPASAHGWCVFSPPLCHPSGLTRRRREVPGPGFGSRSVFFYTAHTWARQLTSLSRSSPSSEVEGTNSALKPSEMS